MNHGKTIELFFVDGTAKDVVTAELSNWNAQAIRLPRTECRNPIRDHIARALEGVGVYFLVCQNDGCRESVYVGEAENVRKRLCEHLREYERGGVSYYWNYAIVFVGGRLDKALIRYLENRLVSIIKECGRCDCLTQNTFQNMVLKPSQIATMEEFIDNVRVVMEALGCKFLVSPPTVTPTTRIFNCIGRDAEAQGFLSPSGGFTVLEGSRVASSTVTSFKTRGRGYYNLRKRLESDGTIVACKFVRNYEFSSPSSASAVVLGRNSNGNHDWKTDGGQSLGAMPQ